MALTVSTAATTLPVTLQEVKLHCRIDGSTEDTILWDLLKAATNIVQQRADRTLVTQTWKLTIDGFPSNNEILLPRPPVVSVSSLKYYDSGGTQQTWSSSNYTVDTLNTPAKIVPAYSVVWPTTRDIINAVEVIYVAGYGNPPSVPAELKAAIRMLVAHWYETREPINVGNIVNPIPETVDALVSSCWTGMLTYPGV